jgi:indolepyruvate ferredoxin oxidoreductase alpha subunit
MEALKEFNLNLPVFKLGFFYPAPKEKFKNFLKGLDRVLVVEELEEYIEELTFLLAKIANPKIKIFGKNLVPETGELRPEIVAQAIAKFVNRKYPKGEPSVPYGAGKIQAPKRLPQLCPSCPYWLVISAIKKAVDVNQVIFGGEIGCYMLFGNPPVNLQDYLSCMGSSVGIGHGIKKASGQKLIAFVGDSSFFHAGIPALINTVFNKSNPLIIILNNETTAMTGHQPHPASVGVDVSINIENLVRACGVKNVKTIDPVNQEEFTATVKEFLEKPEVSVIVAKHPCKFVAPK